MQKKAPSVVLITDFGQQDAFVGILKGVVESISPSTPVLDLTHGVAPQNIFQGAFYLATAFKYFPEKSIFCSVVDPGVGSGRKGICIETNHYYFVGPDNGLLWPAANEDGIIRIVELSNPAFFLDTVSHTFHGRDIFAPVCANISIGIEDIESLGSVLDGCCRLDFPEVEKKKDEWVLTVIHIDHFGNIVLNMTPSQFQRFAGKNPFEIRLDSARITQLRKYYTQAGNNELFLIESSNGYMEISLKNGDAAGKTGTRVFDRVRLRIDAG